ncbi:lactococcin 972 family bacteriocin [Microbacterium sp. CJ88]|uniref:lactococcin 972 family bacteriocin n=1 Tax=Microbacterium sp. CJ88 TaxID=3445672 RepID=UPI003F6581BB
MKKFAIKAAVSAALAVALVGGGAVAANATTEYPAGGTWVYGVGQIWNYSEYHHPAFYHRATAYNDRGSLLRAYGEAGQWAKASIPAEPNGNRAAWYHASGSRNI